MENLKPPSEETFFEVKQNAEIELMQMAGGDTIAEIWSNANGERFDELMNDPKFNFIERLANPDTHDEALLEIKNKLYH